jgi:hypothetical protein
MVQTGSSVKTLFSLINSKLRLIDARLVLQDPLCDEFSSYRFVFSLQ